MRARQLRVRRGERGAVLVIVSVFAIVAIIMLAAVVDLGGQREQRKELTLSTDAAALAAAAVADTEDPQVTAQPNGTLVECDQVQFAPGAPNPDLFFSIQAMVDKYLEINGESDPFDCKVVRTAFKSGYVVVSATEIVDYAFGPALGIEQGGVSGASVAAIDVGPGGGLRPIGICGAMVALNVTVPPNFVELNFNDLWNSTSAGYDVVDSYVVRTIAPGVRSPARARLPIEKVNGGSCGDGSGGGSGNFGKLDFGGGTSTNCGTPGHFCKDLADGYFGSVSKQTKGDTGNNWGDQSSTIDSLSNLRSGGGLFWAPVYTNATNTGGNTQFTVAYFAQLRLLGYCVNSSAEGSAGTASPCTYSPTGAAADSTTYFDVEVSRMVEWVTGGPPVTDDARSRAPRLCAMTDDGGEIAAGCPAISTVTTTTTTTTSTTTTTTTTTLPPLPCVVTGDLVLTPARPVRQGKTDNLDVSLNVAAPVAVAPCTEIAIRIVRVDGGDVLDATPSPGTGSYSAVFPRSGQFKWRSGDYRAQVLVAGVLQRSTTFTLA